MKKFDYLCILYSIALLAFGFDDKKSPEKVRSDRAVAPIRVEVRPTANAKRPLTAQIMVARANNNTLNGMKRMTMRK